MEKLAIIDAAADFDLLIGNELLDGLRNEYDAQLPIG
jgi:hypothetical protein